MAVSVKVTSDFICPWCQIGKQRLQNALDSLPEDVDVDITWQPFELNPEMPVQGIDRKVYRTMKFGSWERSQALDARTIAAGAGDGVQLNYDRIKVTPNTFAAHRLAWYAAAHDRQRPMVEAILSAYFEEGQDIGDPDVLVSLAVGVGLDGDDVRSFLDGSEGTDAVRDLERQARGAGIHGVPHFEIDGFAVSGAQSPEVLKQVILDAHGRNSAEAAE